MARAMHQAWILSRFGVVLCLAMGISGVTVASSTDEQPKGAQEQPKPLRVAIPRVQTSGVEAALAETLTDVILNESNSVRGIDAIGMADIEALLGLEEQKQLLGCDDVSCMAEIGNALGVGAIVVAKLGKVGDTYVLTVRAIDTHEVKVISSAQETVSGDREALIEATRKASRRVLKDAGRGRGSARPSAESRPLLSWPALVLMGFGGAGSVVAIGVMGVDYFTFGGPGAVKEERAGHTYWTPGTQPAAVAAADRDGWACIGLSCSLAVVGVGVVFQLVDLILAGGQE